MKQKVSCAVNLISIVCKYQKWSFSQVFHDFDAKTKAEMKKDAEMCNSQEKKTGKKTVIVCSAES
jgi:hypothetical protein